MTTKTFWKQTEVQIHIWLLSRGQMKKFKMKFDKVKRVLRIHWGSVWWLTIKYQYRGGRFLLRLSLSNIILRRVPPLPLLPPLQPSIFGLCSSLILSKKVFIIIINVIMTMDIFFHYQVKVEVFLPWWDLPVQYDCTIDDDNAVDGLGWMNGAAVQNMMSHWHHITHHTSQSSCHSLDLTAFSTSTAAVAQSAMELFIPYPRCSSGCTPSTRATSCPTGTRAPSSTWSTPHTSHSWQSWH